MKTTRAWSCPPVTLRIHCWNVPTGDASIGSGIRCRVLVLQGLVRFVAAGTTYRLYVRNPDAGIEAMDTD
jgi:hypothetical protein